MSTNEENVQAVEPTEEHTENPELIESNESLSEEPIAEPEVEESQLKAKETLPDGLQKRIDRLSANAKMANEQRMQSERDSQAKIAALQSQLNLLAQGHAATTAQNQVQQGQVSDPSAPQRPNRANYTDAADYADAMFAFTDSKAQYDIKKQQQAQEQNNLQSYIRNLDSQHAARIQEAKSRYDDFDEASDNLTLDKEIVAHPNFSTIALTVMESDKSADLQYYFATNKEKAKELLQMSPHKAALEIGRIESQLKVAQPKISKGINAPTQVKNNPVLSKKDISVDDARKRAIALQKGIR